VEVIHTSLYKRKELSGTEIRCRMAEDGIWNDLVPIQTATVIEEIEGIRRIKAIHSRYSKSNH